MLIGSAAQLLYHSDTTHMHFDPAAVFGPGVSGSLRGESGSVFVTDPDRVEWVVAYAPVPQTGWGLIVAEPWEHVVNPLLRTSLLTPLVLIPAVLIAMIVVIFGARASSARCSSWRRRPLAPGRVITRRWRSPLAASARSKRCK
jgi:hypothetical protein